MKLFSLIAGAFMLSASAADAAPEKFEVEFTDSEYKCARHVVDYLINEEILKGSCRYLKQGGVRCAFKKGAAANPWLWQKAKYNSFEGSEDLRILVDNRYEEDALDVFWDLRNYLDCQKCTKKVVKDCHCVNPISNFKSHDGRFELIFCFTLDIHEVPSCKKGCKVLPAQYEKYLIPNLEVRLSKQKTCEMPIEVTPTPVQQVPIHQIPSKRAQ